MREPRITHRGRRARGALSIAQRCSEELRGAERSSESSRDLPISSEPAGELRGSPQRARARGRLSRVLRVVLELLEVLSRALRGSRERITSSSPITSSSQHLEHLRPAELLEVLEIRSQHLEPADRSTSDLSTSELLGSSSSEAGRSHLEELLEAGSRVYQRANTLDRTPVRFPSILSERSNLSFAQIWADLPNNANPISGVIFNANLISRWFFNASSGSRRRIRNNRLTSENRKRIIRSWEQGPHTQHNGGAQ